MSSESGPETEVISCPACRHLLRVPVDWLGTQVQCPECKAMFRAPVRDGRGGLTEPELISRPASAAPATRKPFDPMLLLPAFGLMFCGIAGAVANAWISSRLSDPVAARVLVQLQLAEMRKFGFGADDPPAEQARLDEERVERILPALRVVLPTFALVGAVAFLGGLSIATRWNYRLAQLGSLAAIVNVPHLCCVPGGVAGVWALLMLGSEEGRAHFRR